MAVRRLAGGSGSLGRGATVPTFPVRPAEQDLDRAIVVVASLMFEPAPRSTIARAISSAGLYRS